MLRLSTFTISHFSEKARWALEHEGIAFRDRRLVPGPHVLTIRRRAADTTVPLLEDGDTVVQGSSAILDYIASRLGGNKLAPPQSAAAASRDLEARVDKAFGLGIQRIFYATLLEHPSEVIAMWSQAGPFWGRTFLRLAYPRVALAVRKRYSIREEKIQAAMDLFRRTFDETDEALAKGPYLLGDRLTRLDITVAALLAPLCRPPEHELRWPTETPPPLDAFIGEFEGRPTFEFVLRMYRDHRRTLPT